MRRRLPWGLVAALFVIVPLVELYLVIQVGFAIGIGWTILILVLDSLLGALLLKREGAAAWRALQGALRSYRMPARELADGMLVLVGGTLLLTPGFFTDALGFFCILPFTRPLARRVLTRVIARRFLAGPPMAPPVFGGFRTGPQAGPQTGPQAGMGPNGTQTRRRPGPGSVVRGEVVDD